MTCTGGRRAIASVFMSNIPPEVIEGQRAVMRRTSPAGVDILKLHTHMGHAATLDYVIRNLDYDEFLFLDIDCIPLSVDAVERCFERTARNVTIGAAQRANHIENGGHVYVGPFCLALSRRVYEGSGSPSFAETRRGDVGEELTYALEERGREIEYLWPSAVEEPMWSLGGDRTFALGTTYDGLFWHSFQIREPHSRSRFVEKCRTVLAALG